VRAERESIDEYRATIERFAADFDAA